MAGLWPWTPAHMSGCTIPTGSRVPKPHNPALLGRTLPVHSQAAYHTPGRATGQGSFPIGGTMALPPAFPTPHPHRWKPMQRPSGQQNSGRGTPVLLGLLGAGSPSEGKRENTVMGRVRATSPDHQPWSPSGKPSSYHTPPHPHPEDSWGSHHRAAQRLGTVGESNHRGRGPHMGGAGWSLWAPEVSCCAPATPILSLQNGWQKEPQVLEGEGG